VINLSYIIFQVKPENAEKIHTFIKDDLVSRQSVLTRDAHSIDIHEDVTYIKVEGSEMGIKRAEELAKEFDFIKISKKKADTINKKILEQEESAADGMGMIFG
jgi:hypothetical protein